MADRHEQLRRLDWRFLLPNARGEPYQHLVVLGGPPDVMEELERTGIAAQVSTTLPEGATADVVACLDGATLPLPRAAAALRPGGCLYLERNRTSVRLLTTTPSRVERGLRDLGLLPVETYLVSPNFESARLYLPTGAAGALAWYVDTLYTSSTARKRLFEDILRALGGLHGGRFARVAPYLAVVAVKPGAAVSTIPAAMQDPAVPAHLRRDDLHAALLGDTDDRKANRVVLLPFSRSGTEPLGVIKIPRLAAFNQRTEHEHITLQRLRGCAASSFRDAMPEPLALVSHGDVSVSIEGYSSGQSLARRCGRWGRPLRAKIDDLQQAAGWLAAFHAEHQIERAVWDDAQRDRWVHQPLDDYARAFGVTPDERALFDAARELADHLPPVPFSIVWQHRDYNVWNLFRSGDAINVIDWEGARRGAPLCDLLHLATHWHDAVRNLRADTERRWGVYHLFCEPARHDRAASAVRQVVGDYMETLELDRRLYPLLLLYTWIELALRRHAQLRDLDALQPDPRQDNQYPAIVGLLARNRRRIIGEDRTV